MQNTANLPDKNAKQIQRFWLCFAFLFGCVLAFNGKTVPFSNEFLYLLRLVPNFLPNDWTFSQPANEHWFFNRVFSLPMYFLPLETVGWLGRISVWSLCLFAVIKLGRLWEISFRAIAAAVVLWLAFAQAVVNDEWIFGGFEAKTVAYVCLLFALVQFSRRKIIAPSVLLGLSFSFHPAVGLWAIPAIGLSLLFGKISRRDFLKVVGLTFMFSLPGLLPLLFEHSGAATFDDWQFIVTTRVPWHLDPFQFQRRGFFILGAMLIFNAAAFWKSENFALRFLLKFQMLLGAFFVFGLILRWLELYPLLRLMPMRLFPVITPLFFMFSAFNLLLRIDSKRSKIAVGLFAAAILFPLSPISHGIVQIRQTIGTWTTAPDDLRQTSVWIAENTPPDAVIIQPPHRRELWYYSNRAQIVSYIYPTFNRLGEWRERVADLTGNLQISSGETAAAEIETAFNRLSVEQIAATKQKYGAGYLVSRAVYPYPIIFETETYKVYQMP